MKQLFSNQFYYQYRMPDVDLLKERLTTVEKFDDSDKFLQLSNSFPKYFVTI